MTTTIDLIQTLRHGGLRVRTALWLLPATDLARLPDEAARLGVNLVDVRRPLLENLAPDQRFLNLGVREIIEALDALCQDNQKGDCLLVTDCDLLIAGLSYHERKAIWDTLYRGFPHRPRAIILAMPQRASGLLPDERQLDLWRREGRLVP